ncbi:hypothetical protein GH714_030392 [Hevea brasiliensis]|uniref:Phosphatidylserine decarboxylase n=1 Tax=Hevea brasiliensis TaxID=3981 RepID=A0A6A6LC94_HEVBR|nr:hypothetical protein GH714_030392 [Hevea brasiliensis]
MGPYNIARGSTFLLPGATVATLLMLGALHARRLYDDKKTEEAREKGIELEFQPDVKATFLRMIPLRSISRFWGSLTGIVSPVDGTILRFGELKGSGAMIEQVVLEGLWEEGFMAIAAIGATNIGSIKLFIEPEFRTNLPRKKLVNSEPPEEQVYEPEGIGKILKKGDEVAAFNMGSTVVLVFQAPTLKSLKDRDDSSSEFRFNIRREIESV